LPGGRSRRGASGGNGRSGGGGWADEVMTQPVMVVVTIRARILERLILIFMTECRFLWLNLTLVGSPSGEPLPAETVHRYGSRRYREIEGYTGKFHTGGRVVRIGSAFASSLSDLALFGQKQSVLDHQNTLPKNKN
jgi:hypothetical protein